MYRWDGMSWGNERKLTAADGGPLDFFGDAVSISGDRIVVGAAEKRVGPFSSQGAAYVYRWNGTSGMEEQELTASDGFAEDS